MQAELSEMEATIGLQSRLERVRDMLETVSTREMIVKIQKQMKELRKKIQAISG